MKGGRSLSQIQDDFVAEFGDASGVDEHLKQFIQLLVEVGMIPESEKIR